MMRSFFVTLSSLSLLFIISCATGLKKQEIEPWLNNLSGEEPHTIDVTGKWHDPKQNVIFGWGEGYLLQNKNKIVGSIGTYNVKGKVTGKRVYLVFLYGGKVYYTGRLEMLEEGILVGQYFNADDKEQANGFPTSSSRKNGQ